MHVHNYDCIIKEGGANNSHEVQESPQGGCLKSKYVDIAIISMD